jgi:hypothetical protein
VLLGNGNGTFQPPQLPAAGTYPFSVAVADLNGDGKPDLVVANFGSSDVSVLLGNGDGTFQPQQTLAAGNQPTSVVAADINADGRPDILVTNQLGDNVGLLLANSNANFTGPGYTIVSSFDTIGGTANVDQITLVQDPDHMHIDWMIGGTTAQMLINDPNGLTINGNGGNDIVTLVYTNGNPLPNLVNLNGGFLINGLPLANQTWNINRSTVFISYPSAPFDPLATVRSELRTGYNAGAWNGAATASTGVILSTAAQANPNHTTAIGYADSSDGAGVNTVPNTIELSYTLYGDANLDHQVNSADLQGCWPRSTPPPPGTRVISTMTGWSTAPTSRASWRPSTPASGIRRRRWRSKRLRERRHRCG